MPGQQSSQAFGPTTGINRAAEMFVCRLFSSLTVSRISDHSIVKPRADILHMKFFTLFWLDMVCTLLKDHLLSFLFISFFYLMPYIQVPGILLKISFSSMEGLRVDITSTVISWPDTELDSPRGVLMQISHMSYQ